MTYLIFIIPEFLKFTIYSLYEDDFRNSSMAQLRIELAVFESVQALIESDEKSYS
jgi:hypothetical protein